MPQFKQCQSIPLPGGGPGTRRELQVRRWKGRGGAPSAYLQAGLHADEVPGLLVAHHLERLLDDLAQHDAILGDLTLVPFANPVGLDQFVYGYHAGRFELDSGINFNRGYPRLIEPLAERLVGRLGSDGAQNVLLIRHEVDAVLQAQESADPTRGCQRELFRMAIQHDLVLDLHCDFEAALHLYVNAADWPQAQDLAAALEARVVMIAEDSGGDAFDEACSNVFKTLAARFPHASIPSGCFASTVELRGERDVDDACAERDARNLLRFLAVRGVLEGDAALPEFSGLAVLLEAVDVLPAPASGVVVWKKPLGAEVEKGELLAEIVVPAGERVPVRARNAGVLFVRRGHRWVRQGHQIAKVGGRSPLPWRRAGALLVD